MNTPYRWIIALSLLGALLLPGTSLAAPLTSVQPAEGPPSTIFTFFANGFAPEERFSTWLNAPDGRIVPNTAANLPRTTSFGDASWTWTAPGDAPRGTWQMVAHGITSATEQVITFRITEPSPTAAGDQPFGVDPADGPPGTLFRFYATGYESREFVYVSVTGPGGPLATPSLVVPRTAAPNGRVDGSWTSPRDATPGSWQIVVRADHSGVKRTIPVTLRAAQASTSSSMSIQPAVAAPGARFVVSASGFTPNEELSIWLNAPDGRVLAAQLDGTVQAAPDGRAGWTWVAPSDAPRGSWQMVAHGRTSGVELVAGFTIQ